MLDVQRLRVAQGRHDLVPPTNLRLGGGDVTVVVGAPGAPLTALALAVAGRLRPSSGTVRLDGDAAAARLQRSVALVDVPEVSAPENGVPLRTVVAEELAFAGQRTSRRRASEWLDVRGWSAWASRRVEEVPAAVRLAALSELATLRDGVTHLVLGLPERHGSTPEEWQQVAAGHAAAGYGVLLTVSHATASSHEDVVVLGDALDEPAPEPDPEPEAEHDQEEQA